MAETAVAARGLTSWPEWLPRGAASTRTVLAAMVVVSLPFLWQGGLPFLPLMLALAWWRLRADGRDWRVPSITTRILLVAPMVLIVLQTSGFGLGSPTGMLLASVWLKLVEVRRSHDHHVQVQFCLLLITAQMLAAIDPFSTAYATGSFLLCLVCLQRTADPAATALPWLSSFRHSFTVLLKALPVALVVFLLVPRGGVQIGMQSDQARTGINDTLQPGSIAALAEDNSRAFTVSFEGEVSPPPPSDWYWRGPVLWRVDERHRWYGSKTPRVSDERVLRHRRPEARRWTQRIVLEPHHQHWVYPLDHPTEVDGPLRFYAGHSLASRQQIDGRLSFTVVSDEGNSRNAYPDADDFCLDLPPNLDPRIHELARRLGSADAQATAEAITAWLREEGFRYTRSPGTMSGDPTADFLFAQQAGFCGHYASAFTILMRTAGHPARVVLGYRGGTWNPYGSFVDVRQRNAHAWCEVYLGSQGWLRIDPTDAAITENGSGAEGLIDDGGSGFFDSSEGGLLGTIGMIYDFIDRAWFQFVYSYDESMQRALLALLGLRGWTLVLVPLLMIVVAGLLAWLAVRFWPRGREGRDRLAACWLAFCRRAGKRGCPRPAHEGPLAFAERAASAFPGRADDIRRFATAYAQARYGRPERAPARRELKRLARNLRRLR